MAEQATTLDESLRAEIKDLICEILKADPSAVTLTSRFVEDHGADSLQYMDALASIERLCGIIHGGMSNTPSDAALIVATRET